MSSYDLGGRIVDSTPQACVRCTDAKEFLRILHGDQAVFEIRSLKCPEWKNSNKRSTASGWFTCLDAAATAIAMLNELEPAAIYCTLNPTSPLLVGRCHNKTKFGGSTTSDKDTARRTALLIDIDPVRPANISSTWKQVELALNLADEIETSLLDANWPEPLKGMSGNGAYLIYRIDLETNDGGIVSECLQALSEKFSGDLVSVDTSTFNPARLVKILGTTARKGDHIEGIPGIEDMPHRRSWFYTPEKPLETVPIALLQDLAGSKTKVASSAAKTNGKPLNGRSTFDIDRWLSDHNVPVNSPVAWQGGRKWSFSELPELCRNSASGHDHDGSGFICQKADGSLSAGCLHDRCTWQWKEYREYHEPTDTRPKSNWQPSPPPQQRVTNGKPPTPEPKKTEPEDRDEYWSRLGKERPIGVGEFLSRKYQLEFLVDRFLVKGQSCIIAGASKSLKTTISLHLALALASGKPFLGGFQTVQTPVLIASAESGEATLQRNIRGMAAMMDIDLDELAESKSLSIQFWVPRINDSDLMDYFANCLDATRAKAVVLDPLYMAMEGDTQASLGLNGEQIQRLTSLIQSKGATAIVDDHVKRSSQNAREYKPITLEDITGAGKAESFRQWMLLGRRGRHEDDDGLEKHHGLWLVAGGSAGHSATWGLDVTETFVKDYSEIDYLMTLRKASEVRQEILEAPDEKTLFREARSQAAFDSKVRRALNFFEGRPHDLVIKADLREELSCNGIVAAQVLEHLEEDGLIVKHPELVKRGRLHVDAWKLPGTLNLGGSDNENL